MASFDYHILRNGEVIDRATRLGVAGRRIRELFNENGGPHKSCRLDVVHVPTSDLVAWTASMKGPGDNVVKYASFRRDAA